MSGKGRRSSKLRTVSLHELKDAIGIKRSGAARKAGRKPAKNPEQTSDDNAFFKEAMKDVHEITEFRKIPVPQGRQRLKTPLRRPDSHETAIECLREIVRGIRPIELKCTQEYVQWKHPDCTDEIVRRLRAGKFAVQEFLALHGLTLEEAETEVDSFIRGAIRKGLRCVRIIHGRGLRSVNGPVLKKALIFWLSRRYRKYVLACSLPAVVPTSGASRRSRLQ